MQPHEQTGVADALKPEDARLARSVLVKKEVEDSKDVTHTPGVAHISSCFWDSRSSKLRGGGADHIIPHDPA